ncbi:helix-turn-helix transcriptional regulator [Paenibacillus gansuensis]|uniref:Helix-turn-helix transcriptional regulator n=1 Tax=Paenibacillus gansuensis TaxID=306542 RepID=A0ABW5PEH8_9BACL
MNGLQDTSTRKVILTLLKTKGSLTVNDLAKELAITEMAVRRHINTLERDGLVASTVIRQAMGRPTNQYMLTPASDELFPKNYYGLTLDLLEDLEAEDGGATVTKLFQRRKEKLLRKYEGRMDGLPLRARVAELAEIQNNGGYMVSWKEVPDGGFELLEHNCPIANVANRFEQACQCELQLFKDLLGVPVERTECLAKGGMKCTYVIQQNAAE